MHSRKIGSVKHYDITYTDNTETVTLTLTGHRWSSSTAADVTGGTGVPGSEAGTSREVLSPDRTSQTSLLHPVCQIDIAQYYKVHKASVILICKVVSHGYALEL
jgi:hypothetical protein